MRLQVGRLGKAFVAVVKRTDIRSIAGVDANVSAEVEVQRESLATPFKRTLQIHTTK